VAVGASIRTRARPYLRRAWARHAPRSFALLGAPSRAELGAVGEELAARQLRRAGFKLLGRRLATPHAEVDLWARRDGESWVIEVKTGHCARLGRDGWDLRWRPGLSLDQAQRMRLARATAYLARAPSEDLGTPRGRQSRGRLALVEVLVCSRTGVLEVLAPVEMDAKLAGTRSSIPGHPGHRGASFRTGLG
jgi:Holliday junction resolvase-like predicted endonuclease